MRIQRLLIGAIVLAVLAGTRNPIAAQAGTPPYRVVGYYNSYDIYEAQYFVTDVPSDKLTDLNYADIGISANGQCVSTDSWADTQYKYPGDKSTERVNGNFKQLGLLKKSHPTLDVLMSVGGWENSKYFSDVAATHESRIRFARSCIAFMRANGFAGIDIDWRYPVSGGATDNVTRPEDNVNFTLLLSELRGELDYWSTNDNKTYLLTATAPAVPALFHNMQLDQIQTYVDWINLMAFDFGGSWSTVACHVAPLYLDPKDTDDSGTDFTVSGAVQNFLDAGVPANKIVVGIPFYGQAWSGVKSSAMFGLFQTVGGIPQGTRPGGVLYYRDLAPLLKSETYVHYFDDLAKAAWMYNAANRIAISYEDPASIAEKMAYIRDKGLAGAAVWELSFDDDSHTLLNSVYSSLNGT